MTTKPGSERPQRGLPVRTAATVSAMPSDHNVQQVCRHLQSREQKPHQAEVFAEDLRVVGHSALVHQLEVAASKCVSQPKGG